MKESVYIPLLVTQVEEAAEEQTETESKSSSFFGRIGQMFQDFGHAIASILR